MDVTLAAGEALANTDLTRRVEVLVPIENPTIHRQIMNQIMAANLVDQAHSWVLDANGHYHRDPTAMGDDPFSCHAFFMENPSLSGRGSAGAGDVPRLARARDELQGPAAAE